MPLQRCQITGRDAAESSRDLAQRRVVGAVPRMLSGISAMLALVACDRISEPRVTVSDVNWACGETRCTASFRLATDASDERVLVLVRAYAGENVASREIVGEHKERLALRSGQPRTLSVTLETRQPANRVRVIVQGAR
jgi:hypothetical protein